MHALAINVKIEPGRENEGNEFLQTTVLPAMRHVPGIVAGYWLAPQDGEAVTMLIFESEEAATAAGQNLANAPRADFASIGAVESRDVVAAL